MSHSHHSAHGLVNRDEEHLRLLGVYHLLFAGFSGLGVLWFGLLPLLLGPTYFQWLNKPPVPPEVLFFGLVSGSLITAVMAFNGWSLKAHRHRLCCIILSCIECLISPVGLVLGISAILVLRRESVRELFKAKVTH
ncbi:MAG TPA: hypothetical protein V6C99_07680 [Oculatellaceae cyanobacterium]|jgi:hypothetical protein